MPNVLLPPFSSIPIPEYMRRELRRRSGTYGINPSQKSKSGINEYRGQMTSWIRVSSNGKNDFQSGFIMKSPHGAADSYGLGKNINYPLLSHRDKTIIGVDYNGTPHFIENQTSEVLQKHRPTLGVESIEVDIRKNVYRAAFIKWKCYTVEQLNYMIPFLMTPYTTVFLEWGWNNFNPTSLVPIGDIGESAGFDKNGNLETNSKGVIINPGKGMRGFYTNPSLFENSLEKSEGMYDGMIGHIINYDYTFNPSEMCFNCTTEIASNSKFYFGLVMASSTNETNIDNPESSTQKSRENFFSVDLYSIMMSYLYRLRENGQIIHSDRIDNKKNPIDKRIFEILKGRLFSPNLYGRQETNCPAAKSDGSPLYITMGCLVDLLNHNNRFLKTRYKINISDTRICAHPNLISCSDTFLIPNSFAPYFCPESISDPQGRARIPHHRRAELPIFSRPLENNQSDKIMSKVLFNTQRQDLNRIINHWRITFDAKKESDYQFPSSDNQYNGKLENIYINFDFIKEQMKSTPDIQGFLKSICQVLNDNIPIWNLEIVDWNGDLSIRDANYFDPNHLNSLKESFGIDASDTVIYNLDAFSQNSILKEFGFGVKLSDAVANMVINQVNNQLSDEPGVIVSQRLTFPKSNDVILSGLESQPLGATTVVPTELSEAEKVARAEAFDKDGAVISNINEKSITFTKNLDGDKKLVSRLIMPAPSGKAKVAQLLNDESEIFSQYNTPPIPGVKIEFSLLGIAGFRTFQIIGVKNLPKPYDKGKVVFQITEVKHSVTGEGWTTRVTALIRPLKSLESTLNV